MPTATRTFRVFVSSTFEDLTAERDALQRDVFPKLRKLCEENGARFQAIDLRWGVRDEAALDQQTMEICLREIERCQQTGIKPNFIVLLGDRYGWRPLPARIEAQEFDRVCGRVADAADRQLINTWYKRDDNAVPPEYLLRARIGEFVDEDCWKQIELSLHRILREAARNAALITGNLIKYEASATHQEILKGLGETEEDRKHVFAFFRDSSAKAGEDPDIASLKKYLREKLTDRNIRTFPTSDYGKLCADVEELLKQAILAEAGKFKSRPALELEIEAHEAFARDRARHFTGRKNILEAIDAHLRGGDRRPLVVYGAPGSGKSAILAKASTELAKSVVGAVTIKRFIGATPESSSGLTLLRSLCEQLGGEGEIPVDINLVAVAFQKRLARATADRPLLLFIDALDQLGAQDPARSLTWLPAELPPHCRLVVSTIEPPNALQKGCLVEAIALAHDETGEALAAWFREARRTLQPEQRLKLNQHSNRCGLPLYLKLAFEEARRWKSFDIPEQCALGDDVTGVIDKLFDRLSEDTAHGKAMLNRSLGYLAASRYGLTEEEILRVLTNDEDVWDDFERRAHYSPPTRELPVIVWSRLFFDLEPYLTQRAVSGGTAITFYHRQFSVLAARRYCLNGATFVTAHSGLAETFLAQPLSARCCSELPYQLRHAERWTELGEQLTSATFLGAKAEAELVADLLEDLTRFDNDGSRIVEARPHASHCRLVADALANSLQSIAEEPTSAVSQLLLGLQSIDSPDSKALQARLLATSPKPLFLRIARRGRPACRFVAETARHGTYHHFLRFSADGRSLVISDSSGRLTRWDWKERRETRSPAPSFGFFRNGSLLADDSFLVTNGSGALLFESPSIWNDELELGTWRILREAPQGAVLTAVSSTGADYALLAQTGPGLNRLLRVSASSGAVSEEWRMPGGSASPLVNHIALSADGSKKGVCFGDGTIALSTGWIGNAHEGGALHGEFVLDDSAFLTSGSDGTVALWDLRHGLMVRLEVGDGYGADCIAWSQTRRLAAVGLRSGFVAVCHFNERASVHYRFRPAVEGWIMSLAFSSCGTWLAVGGRHGTVKIFEVDSLLRRSEDEIQGTWIVGTLSRTEIVEDGRGCYFMDSTDHLYSTLPAADSRYLPLQCHAAFAMDLARKQVVAGIPGAIRRLEMDTGKYLQDCPVPVKCVSSLAISPDGSTLVVIGDRRICALRLRADGMIEKEIASAELDAVPRAGLPIVFLGSQRVLFPQDVMKVLEMKKIAGREELLFGLQNVDTEHRLMVFRLDDAKLEPGGFTYHGWCNAICDVGKAGILGLAIGDALYAGMEAGKQYMTYQPSPDAGIVLYSWETGKVVSRLPARPNDEGAVGLAASPDANCLVASFRHGRLRLASLEPLEWRQSVRVPGFVGAVSSLPGGSFACADNGVGTNSWPVVHVFSHFAMSSGS